MSSTTGLQPLMNIAIHGAGNVCTRLGVGVTDGLQTWAVNQGSGTIPSRGWALTGYGAFENIWGSQSWSPAQRTSAERNETQWKGKENLQCNVTPRCLRQESCVLPALVCLFVCKITRKWTNFISRPSLRRLFWNFRNTHWRWYPLSPHKISFGSV